MKYCAHCGKELLDEAVICMNCGCKSRIFNATAEQSEKNIPKIFYKNEEPQFAKWSKIVGVTSFFIGWLVLGIPAIVLAHLSKKETGGVMCPSARVGFVCGIVSTALSFFIILIIFSVLDFLISVLGEIDSLLYALNEFCSIFS